MMKKRQFPIGLRTIKTAIAVIVAMSVADYFGTTADKLIFAMLGAMAVVEPTFKESLLACLTQVVGVLFGAAMGILLQSLPLGDLAAVGIGIVAIIVLYNALHIRFSPSLPCFIFVMICVTPNVEPMAYAVGRIWDTAIGLAVGTLINVLVFPYDNSQKIRGMIKSLDRDLIAFLEDMFDGDDQLPKADLAAKKILAVEQQLKLFESQFLLIHRRRQLREMDMFRVCDKKAKELAAHLAVLSRMERPGRLSDENRRRLCACGAVIRDERPLDSVMEQDVVTNFHVDRILDLRRELLAALGSKSLEK